MLHDIAIRKWAIWGLLILHIAWIGNHMRLVAAGQINPWRLGGYAMYTVPNPAERSQLFDADFRDMPVQAYFLQYERATRLTNYGRAFRCANVPASALLAFFEENQDLIGRNLAFVYSEKQLVRTPPGTKRVTQGVVVVIWRDERSFTYTNRFCGREETASATLPETLPGATSPTLP
jgi:hypothetical protein